TEHNALAAYKGLGAILVACRAGTRVGNTRMQRTMAAAMTSEANWPAPPSTARPPILKAFQTVQCGHRANCHRIATERGASIDLPVDFESTFPFQSRRGRGKASLCPYGVAIA